MKRVLGAGVLGTVLIAGALVAAPTAAHAALPDGCDESGACAVVFEFTGEVESWTVPAGATQLSFEVQGASGYGHWFVGGLGGSFTTDPADIAPGTQFAIAVGQGGQNTQGGWGGGGDGGSVIGGGEPLYAGLGGGGGSYVFFAGDDTPWSPFAVAGGGSGGAGGGDGSAGGGANQAGQGAPGTTYGAGGTLSGPGAGGFGAGGVYAPGADGTGPASYAPLDGFLPGAGGDGGYAENAPGGSGSGAGGGYHGGGGGSGGIGGSGFNGVAGGGGSGFLAGGYSAQALPQAPLSQNGSRDGRVRITWELAQDTTGIQAAATAATVGQPVTLSAALECAFGAEGGTVTFTSGGTVLGSAAVDAGSQEASIEFTPATAGTMPIEIDYDGRGAVCSAASTDHDLVVSPAASTIVSATASPARLPAGESTALSASVECDTALAGELVFSRAGAELGRAAVDPATGTGTLEYVPQSAGDDPVVVDFVSSDGNCAPAAASIELTVTAASTVVPDDEEPAAPSTPAEPKPRLASTGAEPGPMLVVAAAALLAMGGILLAAVRRRA